MGAIKPKSTGNAFKRRARVAANRRRGRLVSRKGLVKRPLRSKQSQVAVSLAEHKRSPDARLMPLAHEMLYSSVCSFKQRNKTVRAPRASPRTHTVSKRGCLPRAASCASVLRRRKAGVDVRTAAASSVTLRRRSPSTYAHLMPEAQREAIDRLGARLERLAASGFDSTGQPNGNRLATSIEKSLQMQAIDGSANGNRTLPPQRAEECRRVPNCGFSPNLCDSGLWQACRRVRCMDQIWIRLTRQSNEAGGELTGYPVACQE
jgi:hypothetical protein